MVFREAMFEFLIASIVVELGELGVFKGQG